MPTRSRSHPRTSDARLALTLAGQAARAGALYSRDSLTGLLRRGDAEARGAIPTAFDPVSPAVLADPYPAYRELLEGDRLHHSARRREWILSRYDDVHAAARAHDRLSSAEGVTSYPSRTPMMLTSDRPDHTRLRRLAAGSFTHAAIEGWRPAVERLASKAIEAMLGKGGGCDAVAALAGPLPVATIARVLGIPEDDEPRFRQWSDSVVEGFGVEPGAGRVRSSAGVLGATLRLHSYFLELFSRRRRDPGDDVLSKLLASSDEGGLSEDELFWFAFLLLIAGNETTTNLIGTMLLAFAEHPDEYARVAADPSLIRPAVEEALRHTSPIQGMYRVARADHEVGDAVIPAGGRVLLLFGAANRDPRHFPEPDRFDVTRNPSDHLGFGTGIHFCLGAHLARLEAEVVLRLLTERVERMALAGEPLWRRNPALRGLDRLPLRLIPRCRPRV
ncbi:MAG: beta-dihydromenaquinone-9 omega-hydroxylase [Solirubrobacterales bacterium]|nr:beta-dihydromenaquinone-9 omega-hydroxylase [Solirubrobacterales bacterium]